MEQFDTSESVQSHQEPLSVEFNENWTIIDALSVALKVAETQEMVTLRTGGIEDMVASFEHYNNLGRELVESQEGAQYERAQIWLMATMLAYRMACLQLDGITEDVQDLRDLVEFGVSIDSQAAAWIETICQKAENMIS